MDQFNPHVNHAVSTGVLLQLAILNLPSLFTVALMTYYRGADKSLAQPTSRYILFDGENISFDASLVIYTNSTNIPPIIIINRIYETQSSVAVACFPPGRAKDLSVPLIYVCIQGC